MIRTAAILFASLPAMAGVITDQTVVEGDHVRFSLMPVNGGVVTEMTLKSTMTNVAGDGIVMEGFGVASPYVPNRRLNEKLEKDDAAKNGPLFRYSYDCDGANIAGLSVTRTMEPLPKESSLLVRWRVENKGTERQWISPWVRNNTSPGGTINKGDRLDVPTLAGVQPIRFTGYKTAARNWAATTDPIEKQTIYGAFNAEQLHSFLCLWEEADGRGGFQAQFVPRLLSPGEAWETCYRINAVRGLTHVDFASEELAVQLDYAAGKLTALIAAAKTMEDVHINARVLAENGRLWKLPEKKFRIDPGALVRCSYDWTAPGDGLYDFLAGLSTSDGKALDLNPNLSAPHGGIDTQFMVGQPKRRNMPAWTDAPHALDRAPRTIQRVMAYTGSDAAPAVWVEDSLEKVFPEDIPQPEPGENRTVRIQMARNEAESFQVVVRPPKGVELHQVNVAVSGLEGPAGVIPASQIQSYNVLYYPVRIPSYFEGPTGNWPDPLPEFKPFTAYAERCHPIWVSVQVPAETPAGLYKGIVTITSAEQAPMELTLEVTVHDFVLPVTPALKTDFGVWLDKAAEWAKIKGGKADPAQLAEKFSANASAHRVTLRELAQLPAPATDYAAALAKFKITLQKNSARGVSSIAVPPELLDFPEQLKLADAFVAAQKLENVAFCHIADQPAEPEWPALVERMKLWKTTAPHIPLMLTTFGLQPFLPDGVDLWNVHLQVMDTPSNKPILDRIQQNGQVWWYVNHRPPRPYGNFLIDSGSLDCRILFWQSWALGIKGFHYWSVNNNEKGQDPWLDQLDVTPANGDGLLLYPGADGPVNSIRWEVIRDGIEDYDYLAILLDRIRSAKASGRTAQVEKASAALDLKAITENLVSYTRDPGILLKKREDIARAIVELGKR